MVDRKLDNVYMENQLNRWVRFKFKKKTTLWGIWIIEIIEFETTDEIAWKYKALFYEWEFVYWDIL